MVRKARLRDVSGIFELLRLYAKEGLVLPMSMGSICERIREFCVFEQNGRVAGCAALRIFTEHLGEVRSVAVAPDCRGGGTGRRLVEFCLNEAKELGLKEVFVLTKNPAFFSKCGFEEIDKSRLPHKVWKDCMMCPRFPECDEVAMIIKID